VKSRIIGQWLLDEQVGDVLDKVAGECYLPLWSVWEQQWLALSK